MTSNLTALFLGDSSCWNRVRLDLWSVQALWGGQIISVAGDSAATVRRIARGAQHEQRYQLALDGAEIAALLEVLIVHDLLAIDLPDRAALLPDEAQTIITLRIGRRAFSLTSWNADPAHAGLRAIIEALLALEQRTAGLTPIYDGPYQS